MVTGGSGGIGQELVDILYSRNAKIYIAARSQSKTEELITMVKKTHPTSSGEMKFLSLQLDDLTTIKKTAEEFLSQESRLDILWNNAGVMVPPQGSKTVQGWEQQLGINNLGHFLLTDLLRPALEAAAKVAADKSSVRVVWVSSSAADAAPTPAIDFDNVNYDKAEEGPWTKYARSKAGNALHSIEFARRYGDKGIVSVVSVTSSVYCISRRNRLSRGATFISRLTGTSLSKPQALNPGNFVTNLQQNMPTFQVALFVSRPVISCSWFQVYFQIC